MDDSYDAISLNHVDHPALLEGFSSVEKEGRWTDGTIAKIELPITPEWTDQICVDLDVKAFVRPDTGYQSVFLRTSHGDSRNFKFFKHLESQQIRFEVDLDRDAAAEHLEIEFYVEYPGQPSSFAMWNDDRQLGLLIKTIRVVPRTGPLSASAQNPYRDLPAHQFWRKAISAVETHRVDPVAGTRFKISAQARVGTAGSCFAQHISRRIMGAGFNYFVTEDGAHLPEDQRKSGNYGTFSARYGNIYTPTQLLQLYQEAFGERIPAERAWRRPDGRFVDPFRQQIQPEGFESVQAVLADRMKHLGAVRELIENVDIFVFTLGLTEAWRSREDGSVFSAAPGVIGENYDPARYEFVNFDFDQTYAALSTFLEKFHEINPTAKVLLTVSPVPLIATYEPRSVLTSTVYSKSVLRVAAETAFRKFDWIDYFPSYEIITGSFSGGLYYEADWREVNATGVSHAMRCFMNNYIEGRQSVKEQIANFDIGESMGTIVCDEEVMDRARG